MYRIIPCRVFLHRIRVIDSELCSRCATLDDLFHFFFECPIIKEFWDSLASWMEHKQGIRHFPDDLTEEEFLLGIVDRDGDYSLINYVILVAKFYIYKTTVFNLGDPDLIQFILELKNSLSIERLCCYSERAYAKRFKKWETFFNDL